MSLTRVRCPLTRERGGTSWLGVSWGMVKRKGVTSWVGGYVERGYVWGGELKRNVESGTSTREDRPLKNRSKTAQKPLKSCLKNRSKITARNERFLSCFLSKIWAVWAVFPKKTAQTAQTAQILLENRSNRSNLERFLSGISTRELIFCV